MKLLFLNPPFKNKYGRFSRTSRSPAIARSGTIYYPLWLAYAAAVTEKAGFTIKFIDAPAEKKDLNRVITEVKSFNPRLVVIDTSTPSIDNDITIGANLKDSLRSAFIVLAGTHPSALPEETLKKNNKINAVCVEEYDYTIRDLAKAIKYKKPINSVDGLVYRNKKGKIIVNKKRGLIKNLDELPFLSEFYKKHLDVRNYFFAASDYPMVMIITSRGCPGRCTFCVYPQVLHRQRYRFRSPESILKEFEYIKKNLPEIKEIGIEDDTFTAHLPRTRAFCQMLIEKKVKMKWYCNVRVDLDLETMNLMKKAGCRLATVGFESGNQKVLDNIKKDITVKLIKEFVKNAKKAGLLVHGCFMAGNKGETKATLQETLSLAKKLNTDSIQFYPLIVYPGTEAYQWAKEKGCLASENFADWCDQFGAYRCVINLPGLSAHQLTDFCNRAIREYTLRPKYIGLKVINLIKHPKDIKRTALYTPIFIKKIIRDLRNEKG